MHSHSRRLRAIRRAIIAFLVIILLTLGLLEAALRLIDPWGAWRYTSDMDVLAKLWINDQYREYALKPGSYRLSNWSMTVLSDTTRLVPDTNVAAPCKIVLAGDSATFAYGVSDADSWANLLARQFPDVHILNAGEDGYNIDSALATIRTFPDANGFLYLMIDNDNAPLYRWTQSLPAITTYFFYARIFASGEYPLPPADAKFYATLDQILADQRVTIVAFNTGGLIAQVTARYSQVHVIPFYTSYNSRADTHADPAGNRQIAANIAPYFKELVQQVCPPGAQQAIF